MTNPKIRYVFFGSPDFAARVLRELCAYCGPPLALVANPDRPVGRRQSITPPAAKQFLENQNLDTRVRIYQPQTIDDALLAELTSLKPDVFIIAAYAKIVPQTLLNIPRHGTIGVHPSLLPAYRGASPIQGQILDGAKQTGVTLFLVDEKMDHGPTIAQGKLKTYERNVETAETLEEKLAKLGGTLICATLPRYLAGSITPVSQNDTQATFTKKLRTEHAFVDYQEFQAAQQGNNSEAAQHIERMIRAYTPEPGAWTRSTKDGTRIKLLRARVEHGTLVLTRTQHEGKKPQDLL